MKIAYGIDVKESNDPYLKIAEEAFNGLAEASVIGAFWVDIFPLLKYVPSWVPGAGFQKKAAHWKAVNITMAEKPFNYVKQQLVQDRLKIFRAQLTDDSAEKWYSGAIRGDGSHRESMGNGWSVQIMSSTLQCQCTDFLI